MMIVMIYDYDNNSRDDDDDGDDNSDMFTGGKNDMTFRSTSI